MRRVLGIAAVLVVAAVLVPVSHMTSAVGRTAKADLALAVSDSPDPVIGGGLLTYRLVVTNNGPNAASGVLAFDHLRSDVSLSSAPDGCATLPGNTVRCAHAGSLAVGSNWIVPIVVKTLAAQDTTDDLAYVRSATKDPFTFNNTDDEWGKVEPGADLAIKMTGSSGPSAGKMTFVADIVNNGPSAASGINVVIPTPSGATLFSFAPSPPCVGGGGGVSCVLSALASGSGVTVSVVFTAPPAEYTCLGSVTATSPPDPDTTNNDASAKASPA